MNWQDWRPYAPVFYTKRLVAVTLAHAGLPAPRPLYCPLQSERGHIMPSLDSALDRYLDLVHNLLRKVAA